LLTCGNFSYLKNCHKSATTKTALPQVSNNENSVATSQQQGMRGVRDGPVVRFPLLLPGYGTDISLLARLWNRDFVRCPVTPLPSDQLLSCGMAISSVAQLWHCHFVSCSVVTTSGPEKLPQLSNWEFWGATSQQQGMRGVRDGPVVRCPLSVVVARLWHSNFVCCPVVATFRTPKPAITGQRGICGCHNRATSERAGERVSVGRDERLPAAYFTRRRLNG
jgi:hypothetical protein